MAAEQKSPGAKLDEYPAYCWECDIRALHADTLMTVATVKQGAFKVCPDEKHCASCQHKHNAMKSHSVLTHPPIRSNCI